MTELPAALAGAAELAIGRAIGFTRFRGGAADVMAALAAMLAVVVASTLLSALMDGPMDGLGAAAAWRGLAGSVLLLLAEFGLCALITLVAGRAGTRGRFLAALLWCWALVLAVSTVLLLPVELLHRAGGDPTGAQSGTLLLGGGFFLLVGLYLVWLNGFLLRRGLGMGAFGAVLGVLLMLGMMSLVGMAQGALDPVTVKSPA